MSTLDQFFPPTVVKSKGGSGIYVEERCSNSKCGKILKATEPKYVIKVKGKEKPYCMECARKILPKPKPKETDETSEEDSDETSKQTSPRNKAVGNSD
jgi:DNA-directed RNA polymerase subunit RPC12/RpoP